jgi:hypothetical protein
MFNAAEIARGVQGALGLLRQDPAAALYFDNTAEACLRSFRLMVVVAPLYAVKVLVDYADLSVAADEVEIVFAEALQYVIEWLLFPVVFYEIARRRGWLDLYPRYIGALNWINLPGMIIVVICLPIVYLAPAGVGHVIKIALQGLFFYWFLVTTRQVLGTSWLLSTMLLIVSWVPSTFISFLVAGHLGITAAAAG